jgi:hypothetical protein
MLRRSKMNATADFTGGLAKTGPALVLPPLVNSAPSVRGGFQQPSYPRATAALRFTPTVRQTSTSGGRRSPLRSPTVVSRRSA